MGASNPPSPSRTLRLRRALAAVAAVLASTVVADQLMGIFVVPRMTSVEFFRQSTADLRSDARDLRARLDPRALGEAGEAVIGVFGASVAHSFATHLRGGGIAPWYAALTRRFGRPVRIADLAFSGSYSPAQFNMLHLSAHRLSAAIFLDGFNEQFNQAPGCDDHARFWAQRRLSPEALQRPLVAAVDRYDRLATLTRFPLLRTSGLLRHLLYRDARRVNEIAVRFGVELGGAMQAAGFGRFAMIPEAQAPARWENCVRHAHAFARSLGLPIYSFVQPNQRTVGAKPFTAEERACCVGLPPNTPPAMATTYGAIATRFADLDARALRLRGEGFEVRSLTGVFRDTRETVYVDACCHVNTRGNEILADAILAVVAGATTPRSSAGASP
ncbi:MAG: hypothetical protein U0325_24770 [Polyangiales bacterium]